MEQHVLLPLLKITIKPLTIEVIELIWLIGLVRVVELTGWIGLAGLIAWTGLIGLVGVIG